MPPAADTRVALVDPRTAFPQPPFQDQAPTDPHDSTSQMEPRPDHGEDSYRGTGKLKGLSALITGGDSGIGRAVALCFAREGASVTINHFSESDDARETVRLVEEAGVSGHAIEGDLRDESFCNDLVQQAAASMGGLDILVNNAAYQETHESLDEFTTELFDRIFKTNLYAPFWLSKAALKIMPPGGSIINTASIQGYDPAGFLFPYATSKSGLLGMTKALAKLAIQQGVRVNAVAPGPVWTPLIPGTVPKEQFENFGADTLFQRPAQPIEVAPLYVWLASPAASYVTAETFEVTGGKTPV